MNVSLVYKNQDGSIDYLCNNYLGRNNLEMQVLGIQTQEPGTYQVCAQALTYEPWEKETAGEVADSDVVIYEFELVWTELPAAPTVSLNPTKFNFGEAGMVNYTVSGANKVAYHLMGYNPYTGEETYGTSLPDSYSHGEQGSFHVGAAGRNEITFWGQYNGLWSRPSEIYSVIVNPVGLLEPPTVAYKGTEVGESITLGTANELKLEAACEGAENIQACIQIKHQDGSWKDISVFDFAGAEAEIDLSQYGMTASGEYRIELYGVADGCLSRENRVVLVNLVDGAYYGSMLRLPAETIRIESEAFAGLTNVDAVWIPLTVEQIAEDAFSGSAVIIVTPAGSYAETWAEAHGFEYVTE